MLREDIAHGQRVRAWALAAHVGGRWVPTPFTAGPGRAANHSVIPDPDTSNGTGIGNRFVAVFAEPVTAGALRLSVTAAAAAPMLKQFAAFAPGPCALP